MTTSKLVKTTIFVILLVAASSYFGYIGRQIWQLGDAALNLSVRALYPILWLLLALLLVAVTAGLVAALVRPLWICFTAFAASSLTMLFIWGLNLIALVLTLFYLLAGMLYSRGVVKGMDERIRFSVRPFAENQTALAIVLVIAVCVLFYTGYAAQIEREGYETPSFVMDVAMEVAERQIGAMPDLTPEQKEQVITEFEQLFEEQIEGALKPYHKLIPAAVALILLGILTTIVRLFSWFPALILKGVFAVLSTCHVTSTATETREVERLTID
ncbi:MAG: hypothetical protein ACLFVD_01350 [Dehalococcoidia bacterium]